MNVQVGQQNYALLTGYGILDREFRKGLNLTSPKYSDFSVFRQLKLVNKLKENEMTNRHEFYHWEKDDHLQTRATIAAVNTGVANEVTITLSATDHFDSGTKSYPIVTDVVTFANEIDGYVTEVNRGTANAHTIKVKSKTASNDVQAAAVVGSTIVFTGSGQAEASGATETRVPTFAKILQNIGVTRSDYKWTDFSQQNKLEFVTNPENGVQMLHPIGIEDTADNFEMKEDLNMLVGRKGSATNAAGDTVTFSQGLLPEIYANGITSEYFGDTDMTTFTEWLTSVNENYGDGEYLCMTGLGLGLSNLNFVTDFAQQSASHVFFEGGKDQAMNFDFTGIKFPGLGFEIYFKNMKAFSHSGSLGAQGMPYYNKGVMIPCGKALNPKTNEMMPYLQVRYADPGGAANEKQGDIKAWYTGALSPNGATSDVLNTQFHMVSYKALQMFNIKKFMVIDKVG